MTQGSLGKVLVGGMLTTAAARFPDNESMVCTATGRRFRYRETNARCNRLAHGLMSLGFAKGDVVAFLSTNRAEMVEIYFALAKSGIVGIPLNYRLAPAEIIELMRAMNAQGLICEARYKATAQHAAAMLPALRRLVVIGEPAADWAEDYESLLERSPAHEPEIELHESDPFYFNLTSGTTGLPKSYVLTHFNNAALGSFLAFDMTRHDIVMTVFPMFGRVGFAWATYCVIFGLKNVLMNFSPADCLALIERERVTLVNLVATMGAMLLAEPSLPQRDLSSLRAIVYAGSMLPPMIRDQTMERLCPNIYEYYGMQETGALVVSTPEDRAVRPNSIGRVALFAEIKIVDTAGRVLPPGTTGEICGRSPNGITEYFDNPARTAETFRDGWLHTGDLGWLDESGYLHISGRVKDMIITGGQNVHAAEVEAAILEFAGVADCAVIGLPDDFWGEAVTAVIVPHAGTTIDVDALKTFCRERIAGFKTPRRVLTQTAPLPRTPTGKVQKFLLVEQYGQA